MFFFDQCNQCKTCNRCNNQCRKQCVCCCRVKPMPKPECKCMCERRQQNWHGSCGCDECRCHRYDGNAECYGDND